MQGNSLLVAIYLFLQFVSFFPGYLVQTSHSTNYIVQFMYTSALLHPESLKGKEYLYFILRFSRVQHNALHVKSIFVNNYCKNAL